MPRMAGVMIRPSTLARSTSESNGKSPSHSVRISSRAAVISSGLGSSGTFIPSNAGSGRSNVRVSSSYPGSVTTVPSGRTYGAWLIRSSWANRSARLMVAAIVPGSGQE